MNCYVVMAAPDLKQAVAKAFPAEHFYEASDNVWVVAGEHPTCVDVCTALGIPTRDSGGSRGVVWKFTEYYGYFDRALWDKIANWQKQ